jgi:large subunit ribosomal protein L3
MLEFIGKKIGMTHVYTDGGESVALTMIQLYSNTVFDFKANQEHNTLTVAFDKLENAKKVSNSVAGAYKAKSLPIHRILNSFKVKKSFSINQGDSVLIENFIKEGDKINIRGLTTGKGFAGVMKRWNFRGLEASHGVSISHRSHGSTGQRQDPGKTFRGKKMAGHLGVENITVKNLQVVFVDIEKSIIAVKGSIPGKSGFEVAVKVSNY